MNQETIEDAEDSVAVRLGLARSISSCSVRRADEILVGTAEFVVSPGESEERIFFRTEMCADFDGYGLEKLLVGEILKSSIDGKYAVVPLCPLLARHLLLHGEEFMSDGGVFRDPRPDDIRLITRAARSDAQECLSDAPVIRQQDISVTLRLPFSTEGDECGPSFPTI
ncbi:hypothetical protein YW5DRAFT_05203 [Streptomyces sp. Ncost-T6T-1]|uniref:N-acetyltransferase n=1 Tax=Streptomyces sp. Ncost-T6T-1 TaxID=1100828 RepID=UPI000805DF7E|nr:N-acetyltransferase [Streptomyces sp. Ncost-T6T-1]SBU95652.1 hypothetical protein YW5DRAFT_05203 [Streptomyces sp. Ncost-T6T-1]